ncbi:non-ribosomal peptide synthetase [Algicola sagamiensis]|uniref:non-ribosomal peptide synthetase n=1 Tax=Algicola sagamiensis TaxID=163869 RepID=UPI000377EA23|nr:non-ribosomal peptide synthetase [Algicola sagamiensis]
MLNKVSCSLSAAQQEVCLAIRQSGSNSSYHLCDVLEFIGSLDIAKLSTAIQYLVAETESLRITIEQDQTTGLMKQFVHPPENRFQTCFEFVDVSEDECPDQAYQQKLDQLLEKELEIESGPLAQYVVVKLADRVYRIIEFASHLVLDGWAHGLLSAKIAANYNNLVKGQTLELKPPMALESVFQAEEAYRSSDTREKDKAYWLDYCAHLPEPTQLVPNDTPLTKIHRLREVVSGELVESIRQYASEHRLRLSSLLMALCATYLHRVTGQPELAIGMPVGARQIKSLRTIPAMVANILPLHLKFDEQSSALTVAAVLQKQLRRHLLHQTYRVEDMARDLYAERGNKPLFKTLLNIVSYDQGANFEGGETTIQNVANGPAAHIGIDIFDRNSDGRLEIGFNANSALYSLSDLQKHYQRIIMIFKQFIASPERLTKQYSLFLEHERERIYPKSAPLSQQADFRTKWNDAVKNYPNNIAVSHGERTMTYEEFHQYTSSLESALNAKGIKGHDRVAVLMSPSLEWPVVAITLLRMGVAYVPISSSLPAARINHILQDADPKLCIVTPGRALDSALALENRYEFCLEQMEPSERFVADGNDFPIDAVAYVIYTSGSTGVPKGVEVTHRNLVPIANSVALAAHLKPSERVLQSISPGFDMSVLEIMMTALSGAQLVMTEDHERTPGAAMAETIKQEWIDLVIMTPSLLAYQKSEDFPAHLTVLLGGEPCTANLLSRFSHCHLLNIYGPTETSFATSVNEDFGANSLSIGQPTENTRLYVVDSNQALLPPGSWGELFIGGPGVAKGYLNQPERTKQGFIPDICDPTTMMYQSGDRVYYAMDGEIHYIGRQDKQVKLRGLRIELEEVNNAMMSYEGIENAVSLIKELSSGPALIGYVVSQDPNLSLERLKQSLTHQLPYYMIPSMIIVLQEFPLTANGKLATSQLPEPQLTSQGCQAPPETKEEVMICELFEKILGVDKVYANDNFFEMGGHSVLGLQLLNQLKEKLNTQLNMTDFLSAPTPRHLALRLSRTVPYHEPFAMLLPLREAGERPPLFCIHPGGGIAWPYAGLLPYLPEDQPVYAIQSPILQDPNREILDLKGLANEYLSLIQSIQPIGPYQLAGWSVGGNLALLITSLLEQHGHEVSFLSLFDSYPLHGGQQALKLDDETIITRMTRAILGAPRSGMTGLKSAVDELLGGNQVGDDFLKRIIEDSKQMVDLLEHTEYPPCQCDVIFFRAATDILRLEAQQPSLWRPYVNGQLIEYEVNAPHECMLQRQYLEQFGGIFASELLSRQEKSLMSAVN